MQAFAWPTSPLFHQSQHHERSTPSNTCSLPYFPPGSRLSGSHLASSTRPSQSNVIMISVAGRRARTARDAGVDCMLETRRPRSCNAAAASPALLDSINYCINNIIIIKHCMRNFLRIMPPELLTANGRARFPRLKKEQEHPGRRAEIRWPGVFHSACSNS